MKRIFARIYKAKAWGTDETISGIGSKLNATIAIREQLPVLFKKYGIKRLLDVGCGDFNWMKRIVGNLDYYIGIDIVGEIISKNNELYKSKNIEFKEEDILTLKLDPHQFDAVMIANVFPHFSNNDILAVLNKISVSNIKYAFITHYTDHKQNYDIKTGDWRLLNLTIDPFNLTHPLEIIKCNDLHDISVRKSDDKTLSMWSVKSLFLRSGTTPISTPEVMSNESLLLPTPEEISNKPTPILTPTTVLDKETIILMPEIDLNSKKPISIIITAWQSQNYIEECLDSIENQTYFKNNNKFEVLVGVDACQDTLNKLIKIRHKYRNLNIFMMKENRGTYVATNTLLDLIKYDNILRFDSDDIMLPEMINEILRYSDNFDVIKLSHYLSENKRGIMVDGAIFYKKHIIELAGGYRDWICGADSELLGRIHNRALIKELNRGLFHRRIHNNALTVKSDTGFNSKLRKKYIKQTRKYEIYENIKINKVVNEYTLISTSQRKESTSIIIAAYQTPNYIEECLDSIENQTYFKDNDNFEVLVGVDACQDTLNKLIKIRHKYRNLRIFMMDSNMGIYITLNTLIDLIQYRNIIIFDSDDIMTPEMISEIMNYANDYDLLQFSFNDFTNSIKDFVVTDGRARGAIFCKRNVFELTGGFQSWRIAADTELLERVTNFIKIFYIKKQLFYRRLRSNSLSAAPDTGMKSQLRTEYKKLTRVYNKNENIKIERIVNKYREILKFNYDICVVITTFNREKPLKKLLHNIDQNKKNYKILTIIFDDGSENSLDLSNYDVKCIKYTSNHGKKYFWKLITDTMQYCKDINSKYFIYLQDDITLIDDFFTKSISLYESIDDDSKISLGLFLADQMIGQTNWTNFKPIEFDDYYRTQWCELMFISEKKLFEALEYKIGEIPLSIWDRDENAGSGVGGDISIRLRQLKYNMYHVKKSFIFHGDHDSFMNPKIRKHQKLTTAKKIKYNIFASIPVNGRHELLPHTIERLLNKCGVSKVYCIGNNPIDRAICEAAGAEWINHPNSPLGKKWNMGIKAAIESGINYDGFLFVGSSDWISENWIETFAPYLSEYDMVGTTNCYFLDINTNGSKRVMHWKGYSNNRKGEAIGIGRLYSMRVVKKLEGKIFNDSSEKNMDYESMKRVLSVNGKIESFIADNAITVSISTNKWENKHNFETEVKTDPNSIEIANTDEWLKMNFPEGFKVLSNRIDQFCLSKSVLSFKKELKQKYNLKTFYDKNKPVFIFGMHRKEDYEFALNYSPHKVIFWCGSDAMNINPEIHQIKNVTYIAGSKFVSDDLTKNGIKHLFVPVTTASFDLPVCPRGDSIYFYYSKGAENFYGMNFLNKIKSCTGLNIIIARNDTYSHEQLIDVYKKCFIGLRMTPHDGVPTTGCELGLMGRKIIHNGNQPNALNYKDIDDVIRIIKEEYEHRNEDNTYIANEMKKFLDVDDFWLYA